MKNRGFTLVELIMVMTIAGILAAVALPRLFDRTVFESRGLYDDTLAALFYAQKSAIAQRRTVCVAFSLNSVSLTIAPTAGSSNCTSNLVGPTGSGAAYTVTGRNTAVYTSTPAAFSFNALGQPQPNANQTISVSGIGSITVEKETGYVH